jgi:hypothetical protein
LPAFFHILCADPIHIPITRRSDAHTTRMNLLAAAEFM